MPVLQNPPRNWSRNIVGYNFDTIHFNIMNTGSSARYSRDVAVDVIHFNVDSRETSSAALDVFHLAATRNMEMLDWLNPPVSVHSALLDEVVRFGRNYVRVVPIDTNEIFSISHGAHLQVTCVCAIAFPNFSDAPVEDLMRQCYGDSLPSHYLARTSPSGRVANVHVAGIANVHVTRRATENPSPFAPAPDFSRSRALANRRMREPRVQPKQVYSDFILFSLDVEKTRQTA